MSENLKLTCPCCRTELVVDPETAEILAETRPRNVKSFEDAMDEVRAGSKKRADAFSKAFDRTRNLEDVLQKKFDEAKKKAEDDDSRPYNPLDLD